MRADGQSGSQPAQPRAGLPEASDLPYWAGGPCESATLESRCQEQFKKRAELGTACEWISSYKLGSRYKRYKKLIRA